MIRWLKSGQQKGGTEKCTPLIDLHVFLTDQTYFLSYNSKICRVKTTVDIIKWLIQCLSENSGFVKWIHAFVKIKGIH